MAVTVMTLRSRYRFITTEKQLREFLAKTEVSIDTHRGTVNFIDSNLLSKHSAFRRMLVLMSDLRDSASFVIITNSYRSLDRRLQIIAQGDTSMQTTVVEQKELK